MIYSFLGIAYGIKIFEFLFPCRSILPIFLVTDRRLDQNYYIQPHKMCPVKITEKKLSTIITLKHETWYDAMEVRVPVSKTVKVRAKGAEVFNSLWTLATEKLNDNAAHILLFDRDIEKNPRVVRSTSVWNRTLQSWA